MTTVTTVTANAAAAEAADDTDYLEILAELLSGRSLQNLADMIVSADSKTLWGLRAKGERPFSRRSRNELRRFVKLPELPPTLAEVMEMVDENAEVKKRGSERPNRVLLYNVPETPENAVGVPVTPVTRDARKHSKREYRDLFDMPVHLLAKCVKERYEYG